MMNVTKATRVLRVYVVVCETYQLAAFYVFFMPLPASLAWRTTEALISTSLVLFKCCQTCEYDILKTN